MKIKNLLFILFAIYWLMVYGAGFFSSDNFRDKYKNNFLFPVAYKMYAPPTTTNYNVFYDFYHSGRLVREINLWDEFKSERKSSFPFDKKTFIKRRLYLESLKRPDFVFQQFLYDKKYKGEEFDFNERIESSDYLKGAINNLSNFINLYADENPELIFDSVVISAKRSPIVISFKPEYRKGFTYEAGEGVFYKTTVIK